jgi:23S rRNA pseudouridine2605 synthase
MQQERLQKIIAHAGVSSRREAEAMIREGRVTLNGRVVTELGTRADPDRDHIKVDGKLITKAEPHRYILLYKPKEVMTTVEDPQGRRTVIDLVRGIRERIYPVGRLDFHSEGLVLLTNDGELAFKVSHPTHGSVKTYSVKVRGVPDERMIDKLRRGITIDGKRTLPCDIERMRTTGKRDDEGNSWFEVKLREGRTQQIRKMFQFIGHPVSKLRRVAIGPIADPKLTPGVWRELTKQEVKMLETMKELKKPVKPRRTTARPVSRKKPAAAGAKRPAARAKARPAASRATATRTSTRRTPSPRPASPRPKIATGKKPAGKKAPSRRADARPPRSSARRG